MKKTKCILAVVLSILLMAVIPLNAFAAKLVDTIDLTVNIEPGMMMEDYEDYVTINTPGIIFNDYPHVGISEIIDEESYSPFTEYFEPGCIYEIVIILDVEDGYVFADRESDFKSVTVNGEEAFFETFINEENEETDCYAVYATVETDGVINEIDLTVKPVAGYMIDDYYRYVNINNPGVIFEETLAPGVRVTDAYGADPFNYFIEEEYSLEICLTPARGCEFSKDENGNIQLENVTVNGEAVEYTANILDSRGYIEYVTININIAAAEETVITYIELTIDDDLKGYDVADYEEYITIETPGINFDTYNPEAVYAYDSDYEYVSTFAGGERYCLCMNFTTEGGYFFDPDGVVLLINGSEYIGYYFTYENGPGNNVEVVFADYITDYTGNFFDRVIAWFINAFEDITAYLFGWISI